MGFFGGGASVDLASPPAIGSTTPNTGAFTTLSFAPAANTTGLSSSSYSLTGSNAQSLVSLTGTWNTTGTPTAVLLNITDTASNASSILMGMQIGGANRFQFLKDGRLRFNVSGTGILNSSNSGIEFVGDDVGIRQNNSTGAYKVYFANAVGLRLGNNYYLGWSNGAYADNSFGTIDLTILRDGADALAQRRSTNAQTFRLYNTFTDASNYERGFLSWTSNTFRIGTEKAGTGSQRNLEIYTDGTLRMYVTNNAVRLTNNAYLTLGTGGVLPEGGGASNYLLFRNNSGTELGRFQGNGIFSFTGTTSSFPALKPSSAVLQVRLADDSGYTVLDAQLRAQGTAPATAVATGTAGDIRYDSDYIYICTATNTWKRVAIATWP